MLKDDASSAPQGNLQGLKTFFTSDVQSGFLVFLIALPLCLGISLACGYPAVAGIFTAVVGSLVATLISNSELTIKGPAAGLIVIALGCATDFGFSAGKDPSADFHAYRMALAVGVAAGIIQIGFALFKSGILGELFPLSAVHGMLGAIGVIIFAKQFPILFGVSAKGEPLQLLMQIPHILIKMNPEIAIIGGISLIILFGLPFFKNRYVKMIPAPMVVVLVAIPLGIYFGLGEEHTYTFMAHPFKIGQNFLVGVPNHLWGAVTFPDFSALKELKAWKWVAMFAIIGSLESLLSAKAVDLIDLSKRKTNLDRDLLAVGIGNTLAACIGGLPMISEIVRSRANIDNGAKTRFSNMYHGLFLLLALALFPHFIHKIPLAALAAMLVYTGFRLASPKEFITVGRIGKEQLLVYVGTMVAVLTTDLLTGIVIGIGIEVVIHLINGAPIVGIFKAGVKTNTQSDNVVVSPQKVAIFTNWLRIKWHITNHGLDANRSVVVDLSDTSVVDHTVMEKLHQFKGDFANKNLSLSIRGLEDHQSLSDHPLATQRKDRRAAAAD